MKYGLGIRKGTHERVKLAVGQDPSIITTPDKISEHKGVPESYLVDLGLTRGDLKRLERYGLAKRGYTPNYWPPGSTLPSGRILKDNEYAFGSGHRVRWVLFVPEVRDVR